jgi:hypothetical protein
VSVLSLLGKEGFPSVPPAFIGPKHVQKRAGHAPGTRAESVLSNTCWNTRGTVEDLSTAQVSPTCPGT